MSDVKILADMMAQEQKENQEITVGVQGVSGIAMIQPVPKPTMYDTHVKENFQVFGLATLLYACLYTFCMYKNSSGITYPILIIGGFVYVHFCLKKLELKWKKESLFYVISIFLLAISTCCTADWRIIFLNKVAVFFLTICMLLGLVYDTRKWELTKYFSSILQTVVMAIGEVGRPFSDAMWFCKNKLDKKNSKYLYALAGVGITIPFVFVVFNLLSSADAVFRDLGNRLLSGWDTGDWFGILVMFAFAFFVCYCLLVFLCKKTIKEEVADTRKWEPMIAIPVVSVLSLMYLVFSGIQIVYLFLGNMQLPAGYTYAAYAREGFFQLLAVSILNLAIVLIGLCFFKPSKVLKVVLTIMSLCTFIMIASSAVRMIIYIQYYYLTFLRMFVLWSLVVLFALFVGVVVYIVKKDFPLFRYSMVVVSCLYIAFSFSHPDYWIAKVNLAGTQEHRSDFFKGTLYDDYDFLSELNPDAAPVMLNWIFEEGYHFENYGEPDMSYDEYTRIFFDRWVASQVENEAEASEWEYSEGLSYIDGVG